MRLLGEQSCMTSLKWRRLHAPGHDPERTIRKRSLQLQSILLRGPHARAGARQPQLGDLRLRQKTPAISSTRYFSVGRYGLCSATSKNSDPEERKQQYEGTISALIAISPGDEIVGCGRQA